MALSLRSASQLAIRRGCVSAGGVAVYGRRAGPTGRMRAPIGGSQVSIRLGRVWGLISTTRSRRAMAVRAA